MNSITRFGRVPWISLKMDLLSQSVLYFILECILKKAACFGSWQEAGKEPEEPFHKRLAFHRAKCDGHESDWLAFLSRCRLDLKTLEVNSALWLSFASRGSLGGFWNGASGLLSWPVWIGFREELVVS